MAWGSRSTVARHSVSAMVDRGEPGELPPGLVEIILRCLASDPEERWPDFGSVAGELREVYAAAAGQGHERPEPKLVEFQADGLNNRALSMLDLGRPEEARDLWEAALAAEAGHLTATYNMGLYDWRCGRLDDVSLLRNLRDAGQSRAEDSGGPILRARVALESGDCEGAAKELEGLPAADADRPEAAAMAREIEARADRARRCLRTFEGHESMVNSVCLSADGRWALSGSGDNTLKLWALDWELEDKEPADWDDGALPYVMNFLTCHTPYSGELSPDPDPSEEEITQALTRAGQPQWTVADFKRLLHTLGCAGFGWLRPEGVRKKLEEIAANWQGPPTLGE